MTQETINVTRFGDAGKRYPLHTAAANGRNNNIRTLLGAGYDINAVNAAGNTPLLSALKKKRQSAALELLGYGADVNNCGGGDVSPLTAALKHKCWTAASRLLEKGAEYRKGDETHAGDAPNHLLKLLLELAEDAKEETAGA